MASATIKYNKVNNLGTSVQTALDPSTHEGNVLEALTPAICVICLDRIADEAIALPCKHDQFHFSCLGTWLQQVRACPLCKRDVKAIRYRDEVSGPQQVYYLAEKSPAKARPRLRENVLQDLGNGSRCRSRALISNHVVDEALVFRRRVYEQRRPCLYVGSNRYSAYRNITSVMLSHDASLVTKAKKWIRRELGVFDFLNPNATSFGGSDRRATNAEFLLEYIVAIIKAIEIKGSAGQAEELLKDYLGRDNARLFLHELEAWLRSPYESLKDWDEAIQYPRHGHGVLPS